MTYEEQQIDTAKRWVLVAKYARLCQRDLKRDETDARKLGGAIQARSKLAYFTAELIAREVPNSTDDRIAAPAPELKAHFDELCRIVVGHAGSGPEAISKRRSALEAAFAHGATWAAEQLTDQEIALSVNEWPARGPAAPPTSDGSLPYSVEEARQLVDEARLLRDRLDSYIKEGRSLCADDIADSIEAFASEKDVAPQIKLLDAEIRNGASPEELTALLRPEDARWHEEFELLAHADVFGHPTPDLLDQLLWRHEMAR